MYAILYPKSMKPKSGGDVKRAVANTFGSLGYLFCFLQWFWAIMLYFSVIQSVTLFISPNADKKVEQTSNLTFTLPGPLEVIILVTVVAIMVAITIYALLTMPRSIVRTSHKIVNRTAETMVPVVMKAQHKHDTKKFRAVITSRLALAIKVLLIVLPIALTTTSGLLEKQSIDYTIAMVAGGGLASLSILFFAIQYLLAGLLRVRVSDLW